MATPTTVKKRLEPIVHKLMSSTKIGVVVSAGKMDRAVKVRIAKQEWNKKFNKHFPSPETHLVSDPQNSLVEGDVVRIASGWRTSKSIRHVVTAIIAPFGSPVEDRPPVLNEEERMQLRIKERIFKDVRSAARGRIASTIRLRHAKQMGLEIPDLEEAMKKTQLAEAEHKANKAKKGNSNAGKGTLQQEIKKMRAATQKLKDARQRHTS